MRRRFSSTPELDAALKSVVMTDVVELDDVEVDAPTLTGKVNLNHRGFGFVTTAEGDAYYMRPNLARTLLSNDVVQFQATTAAHAGKLEVRAVLSVERPASWLFAEVHDATTGALVSDEPCFMAFELPTDFSFAANGVLATDVVVLDVPAYSGAPAASQSLKVAYLFNLGQRTRDGFDIDYALVRYGFYQPMPAGLDAVPLPMTEFGKAVDYSDIPLVTVDGESTLDLDDAIFASKRPDGGWDVVVAIADVSFFVPDGGALDEWAAKRCTTVYLPGRVTPMLPESLSNGLCSLKEGELRRAVLMFLTLDAHGNVDVTSRKVTRGLIRSAARLSYLEVADYMAGAESMFSAPVTRNVDALIDLYGVLATRRSDSGMLDFEEPEPFYTKTPEGNYQLKWEPRTPAHKLVEELMLLANRNAASMLVDRYGAGLFRHQPAPDSDAWEELCTWASARDVAMPDTPCLRAMSTLVSSRATAEEQVAAGLRVRMAMRPAKYVVRQAPDSGGHFSLNVDWYTHFTSPIRRYADLLVHRLLLAPANFELSADDLADLTARVETCSDRAQAARLAERRVWDHLKLRSFTDAVPVGVAATARIVRPGIRGMRVLIQEGQCAAWLPAGELIAAGCQFVDDVWVAPAVDDGSPRILHEGVNLAVEWVEVSMERPAYPELIVRLTLNGV